MTAAAITLSSTIRRQATVALMIATAMQAFDATIANVALPQLEQSLGGGIDLGSWVMTSYLCASAVMTILTGWLRRRFGPRRLFMGATGLFVFGSVLCSIAPSSTALIQFRLVQGAAAGVIQPLAQAILLDIHPKEDHGRLLAWWGATIMVGPVLGPILGGMITDLASWRWIFVLNVPLGLIAIFGSRRIPAALDPALRPPMDGVGMLLLVVGVGALQLALQRSIVQIWPPSPEVLSEGIIAVLALTGTAIHSARSQFALFRFQVFHNVNFATSAFYNFMVGAILFTSIVFLPAVSEGPLGYDATQAGLMLSPRGIGTMAMMLAVGYLIDRIDHRVLLGTGLVLTAGGLGLIARAPLHGGAAWLASANALQGVGIGLLFTPLSTLAFSTLAAELRTDATGVYNLLRHLGCATGVAMMTAVLQSGIQTHTSKIFDPAVNGGLPSAALSLATFVAYTDCFRLLAVITLALFPGIFLFRVARREAVLRTAS